MPVVIRRRNERITGYIATLRVDDAPVIAKFAKPDAELTAQIQHELLTTQARVNRFLVHLQEWQSGARTDEPDRTFKLAHIQPLLDYLRAHLLSLDADGGLVDSEGMEMQGKDLSAEDLDALFISGGFGQVIELVTGVATSDGLDQVLLERLRAALAGKEVEQPTHDVDWLLTEYNRVAIKGDRGDSLPPRSPTWLKQVFDAVSYERWKREERKRLEREEREVFNKFFPKK